MKILAISANGTIVDTSGVFHSTSTVKAMKGRRRRMQEMVKGMMIIQPWRELEKCSLRVVGKKTQLCNKLLKVLKDKMVAKETEAYVDVESICNTESKSEEKEDTTKRRSRKPSEKHRIMYLETS
ncbi:hypothetical protein KM043_013252 [Ampulex compressa]|nr:hypothetical protein KM043_013252 [Ampulex compressa]